MALRLSLVAVLLLLLVASTTTTTAAAAQALPGCSDKCGNLTIPYPFGMEEGCYLREEFFINCSNTTQPPTAYLRASNIIVTNISLDEGELQISNNVAEACYNEQGNVTSSKDYSLDLPFPYTISDTKNKFYTVGCDTYSILQGFLGEDEFDTGCISICNGLDIVDQYSCSGAGCCQTNIPRGLKNTTASLYTINGHEDIWEFNPCSYAFIAEQGQFNFSAASVKKQDKNYRLPAVLNWAIGNDTDSCAEAQKRKGFACTANSRCANAPINGSVGTCASAYLVMKETPTIQMVAKCTALNPCNGLNEVCINSLGNYSCLCRNGYKNNGPNGKCIKDNSSDRLLLIILSLGLFVILLVGSLWMYWGLKKRKFIKLKEKYFTENGGLLLKQKLTSQGGSVETTKLFTAEELEKATNNYHESRILGEGGYGTVYRGILPDNQVVAIKKSKVGAPTQTDQFVNEVIVLSQVNHRNVVRLLGCCLETEVPLLVYEFITQGTLFEHIHKKKGKGSSLSWELRLKIASETAGALAYLHSSTSTPIIHRDVKTMNILLDDNYTAKVSDFGASRFIPIDQTQLATMVQGTFGYLDPGYFHSNQLTEKSDVYSFGVVLAELLTSKVAFSFARAEAERCLAHFFVCSVEDGHLNQILYDGIIKEGDIDQRVIENVAHLARRCLRVKGEERPTMREVAMELEGMIMTKHPRGSADHYFPEETTHLLGSPNTSKDYVVNFDGDGGPDIK
ncbi:putative transferase, protein kinase RLK-Pelle-WAK family [Rosa chinensis]|uniref:Putative transferase, protein kinase RLK-Pelle-WAK family n=1 Tax=Rosa chinensis TaxID=74649 RepID=A0A2P6Q690_ROSCH|nr:putative transferase, protein kinase RLK-Pelle-WAK family [Rosa chinensis]